MTTQAEQLKVFVSSTMSEPGLLDVRDVVGAALKDRGINAWVFEADAAAGPEPVVATSLREVRNADVYVGLFYQRLGQVTLAEYREARVQGKPCFVYVRDEHAERDEDLRRFLEQEILSLDHGVTYAFFGRATSLGPKVADDIMVWLVRTHREMTARLEQASISATEVEKLRAEIARLESVSSDSLPGGTSMDYLALQLRGWFAALSYRLERHEERGEKYFEWIVQVPARRGYDRIVVHGVEGELQRRHVEQLRQAVSAHRADEGWGVALRRVSEAARSATGGERDEVRCFTLDELIDEDADFTRYLDWLEGEIRRLGIDRMYAPLACTVEEIDPGTRKRVAVSRYGQANGWIDGYIDRWLDDPSKEHVSVLGEFGSGKTWFVLHYAWRLLQRYKQARERGTERPRLPLVIPLRDYAKAVSIESLFSEFFFRKHEINLPGYSVFSQLNRMGKLLLLFDGFDEMAARVDRQQMINNFWELAKVVEPGAKAVLTCRTEHFPEARQGRDLLSAQLRASTSDLTVEPPQFEVVELQPMEDPQIREVLSHRASPATVNHVMAHRELRDLLQRPVMSELVLDALPDIEGGKPVDLARAYLYAIRRKMERDIRSERTFTSLADKLYFLCELSWEMLATETLSLNYRQIPDRLRRYFGSAVQEEKDLDHWHYDMMGQTILIRNAEGDYTPAHRSLIEFFAAYKLAAEFGVLAPDFAAVATQRSDVDPSRPLRPYTWAEYFALRNPDGLLDPLESFQPAPFDHLRATIGARFPLTSASVRLFLAMTIADDAVFAERLRAFLLATKGKPPDEVGGVGGCAATLLLWRVPDALRGWDLTGANLAEVASGSVEGQYRQATLFGADLRRMTLDETNLRGANLSGVDLSGAILRGANLRWVDLGETDLSGAILRGANLFGAILSRADLRGADLFETNLDGADLDGADLFGADLTRADLGGANLGGADLTMADLGGADLRDAIATSFTRWPEGFDWEAAGAIQASL